MNVPTKPRAPSQRRQQLVVWLAQNQFASIADLAQHFSVSEMTVRRDLAMLAEKGLVERVTGGGEIARSSPEPPFTVKRDLYAMEKAQIAQEALKWIQSDMTIALSAGTTTWKIAQQIRGFSNLTFITNSTNVALALQQGGWERIILSGGNFRTPSDALVGPIAERTVRELYSDVLFLGVHAMDWEAGFSTPNVDEAAVDRGLIQNAKKVVVVLDHSKWGQRSLCKIAPISAANAIITDDRVRPEDLAQARAFGLDVYPVAVSPASLASLPTSYDD